MSPSAPQFPPEAQTSVPAEYLQQRIGKKIRACVPCHDRKVRCDATDVGLPCTRCTAADRAASCVLVVASEKTGSKRKRADPSAGSGRQPLAQQTPTKASAQSSCLPPHFQLLPQDGHSPPQQQQSGFDPDLIVCGVNQPPPPEAISQQETVYQTVRDEGGGNSPPSTASQAIQEDDSQLQICREMTQWSEPAISPTRGGLLGQGREIMEYHGGINQMTILSEVFGKLRPKRFVRIVLNDNNPPISTVCASREPDLMRMDDTDRVYLRKKGAFDFPPRHLCDQLLRLYFECVYPYAPIFDRVEFMHEYKNGTYSAFLLQAILASVASYASPQLIQEAGFSDNVAAQRTYFLRASLLCDLKAENHQLRLLQGSLVLSLLNFSFAIDKDYRFWLSNAVRIATQMGLHRDVVAKDLGEGTRTLFRRLWWVIYNRDALLVSSGLDNVRRVHDNDFDTSELELSDWQEENLTEEFADILPPITRLQKLFLIESCKLSRISAQYIQRSRFSEAAFTKTGWLELEESLATWKRQLPHEMRTEGIYEWSVSNIWPLVLMARCYLLECILYRVLRDGFRTSPEDASLADRSARRLRTAMFELDSVLDRVMLHKLSRLCPLYLMNCASTLLALHIEVALNRSASEDDRLTARIRIHQELKYLRGLSDYWSSIKWARRLFEVIVSRTGLSLSVTPQPAFDLHSTNPFNPGGRNNVNVPSGRVGETDGGIGNENSLRECPDLLPSPATSLPLLDFVDIDDTLGNMMGKYAEDWLQDLFGPDFGALEEYS